MTTKQQLLGSTTLPLDQLRIDDKVNVRKIGRGADANFIASVKALGIQMPLIVRPNGKGYVVADGGKRLEAAQALVKSGDLAADAAIPVIVTDASDAEARELSLALNLVRSDMHPVDAFRAFSTLHTDKEKPLDVDALAARFGVSPKVVRQRLALGALDDAILNAWRDGKINEETAQAFTLCQKKKDQAAIYAKLVKTAWQGRVDAEAVKDALNVDPNSMGRFINAVGAEAYEARGGKVTRDLFGSDHMVSDEALLKLMVDEKLAETCKKLLDDGWAWATSDIPKNTWEFGKLQAQFLPTAAEKKEIERLLARANDESLSFKENEEADEAHDRLKAEILLRTVTAKQKAKAGCFVTVGNDGAIAIDYGRTAPPKVKVQTTVDEETGETTTSLGKKKKAAAPGVKKPAKLSNALLGRLTETRVKAIKAALVAQPFSDGFATMLAGLVAAQIRPSQNEYSCGPDDIRKKFGEIANAIAPKIMNAALRKAFNAKDYFDSCGKAFCVAAVAEAVNADEARKISKGKKAEIAKFAFTNVSKTPWLPKELRTANYDGPAGGKTKAKAKTKAKGKTKKAKR